MRTKLHYVLIVTLLLGQKSFSQDAELSNRLIKQLNDITNQTNRSSGFKPITRTCISSVLLEAKKNWERLTPEAKNTFKVLTTRPSLSGTEITASTTNFRFHFTLTGADAIDPTDADSSSYPDYVEQMAGVLENVWTQYENRNYTMPPLDDSAGGDSLFDVYIYNIGSGHYGAVASDLAIADNPQSSIITETTAYTSFMKMNNDYSWATTTTQTALDAIKVTAAHEFFHAIQFGTSTSNTNFLMEATAAWSEDEIYPGINDNLQYLPSTFNTPDIALNLNANYDSSLTSIPNSDYSQHWYGAWIFFKYLTDNTDSDIIRQIFNETITQTEFPAIDSVLNLNYNISFDDVFKYYLTSLDVLSSNSSYAPYTYSKADVYKNSLNCSGVCYEKSFDFKGTQLIHSSSTKVSTASTFGNERLMRLGADYFDISTNQNFKIRCAPTNSDSPIKAMLLKYNLANGTVVVVEGQLLDGYMEISVVDYQNYDAYTLIVYRPDYVANNENSLDSEQYIFDITPSSPLATKDFDFNNVLLYPNPAKTDFNIETKDINIDYYELVNSLGQIVKSSKVIIPSTTQKIDVSDLEDGMYFAKFKFTDGFIVNKKVVVKK